ncbi:MAG: hypothetical protein ACRBDL_09940 [Alphaproteobacteria bacterium]
MADNSDQDFKTRIDDATQGQSPQMRSAAQDLYDRNMAQRQDTLRQQQELADDFPNKLKQIIADGPGEQGKPVKSLVGMLAALSKVADTNAAMASLMIDKVVADHPQHADLFARVMLDTHESGKTVDVRSYITPEDEALAKVRPVESVQPAATAMQEDVLPASKMDQIAQKLDEDPSGVDSLAKRAVRELHALRRKPDDLAVEISKAVAVFKDSGYHEHAQVLQDYITEVQDNGFSSDAKKVASRAIDDIGDVSVDNRMDWDAYHANKGKVNTIEPSEALSSLSQDLSAFIKSDDLVQKLEEAGASPEEIGFIKNSGVLPMIAAFLPDADEGGLVQKASELVNMRPAIQSYIDGIDQDYMSQKLAEQDINPKGLSDQEMAGYIQATKDAFTDKANSPDFLQQLFKNGHDAMDQLPKMVDEAAEQVINDGMQGDLSLGNTPVSGEGYGVASADYGANRRPGSFM